MKGYLVKQTGTDLYIHYSDEIKEYVTGSGNVGACVFNKVNAQGWVDHLKKEMNASFELIEKDIVIVKPQKIRKKFFNRKRK